MKSMPTVAIVGRANVGKSSLFNRLVGYRQAIEADVPGTTRDPVYGEVAHGDQAFLAIDTAGLKTADDDFELSIQEQILEATEAADLIVVVVEANTQIAEEDRKAAKLALKSRKPVILALNKADKLKKKDDVSHWKQLGIKSMTETSTTHNTGMTDLLNEISKQVPKASKQKSSHLKVAILGRPNVGKSALFNAIGNKQQAIVSNKQGTTRDVNRIHTNYHSKKLTWLDTAGIRRSGKIEQGIEQFSVVRSIQAISEADVCLLLLDANEYNTRLDQKIAGMIKDAGKPMIIVVSKWDSIDKDSYTRDEIAKEISLEYQFVRWAPLIFTSSVTGQNVSKLFDLALKAAKDAKIEFPTSELNGWLKEATTKQTPAGLSTYEPKIKYVVQTDIKPPTLRFYGKELDYLHFSYKRYLESSLRERFGIEGTPVWLDFVSDKPNDED